MTTSVPALTPPRVEDVWRRWEPRFLAAGVDWNLVQRLRGSISTWDEWCARWCEVGEELTAAGDAAYEVGRTRTAADLWGHASLMFHFGGMYFLWDREQMVRATARSAEVFARAAPHLSIPAIALEVSVDGARIRGYLRVPETETPPPVALFFSGFEGTKEENQARTREFLDRGIATLSWDGPGRGESEHVPMTGDVTAIASAWIDLLETRTDVDGTRLAATGPNRGAHAAAKAAAREPRIGVLAVASPGYDRRSPDFRNEYETAFFRHLFHVDSDEALLERLTADDLTLEGDAERITCPTLIVAGDRDFGAQLDGSRRLYDEVVGEKHFELVAGAERNGNNVPYLIRPLIADFVAEQLQVEPR